MAEQRLLLISRDDILRVSELSEEDLIFRRLARLTREGFQLLATAPQSDDWSREHGGPDDTLLGPESIRNKLSNAGGVLDGVYYVPRSLMTQMRNREKALIDIMERYGIKPAYCHLFSSNRKFVDAAAELGINATYLENDDLLFSGLDSLLSKNV